MTLSINKLLADSVSDVDVLPMLSSYTLQDVLSADWVLLCKFNSIPLARWLRQHLISPMTEPDSAKKDKDVLAIGSFLFPKDADLHPVHIAVQKRNVAMFDLILSMKERVTERMFELSFYGKRNGNITTQLQSVDYGTTTYSLIDYCSIFGGEIILRCLFYYLDGKRFFLK